MIRLSIAVVLLLSATLPCGCGRGPRPRAGKARSGRVGRPNAEAKRLNVRGCRLRDLGEYDSAMYFFRSALELGRKNRLGMRMAAAYQNMGTGYSDRAYDFREYDHEADLESAVACYDSARRILLDSGKYNQAVSLLTDMAVAYFRDPKYQKRAESLFQRARREARERGRIRDEGFVLYHQAQLRANQAVDARDLPGLRSAVALLDTAVVLLRKAGDAQLAGSAELMAEDWHQAIVNIAARAK